MGAASTLAPHPPLVFVGRLLLLVLLAPLVVAGQTGQIVHSATLQPEYGSDGHRFGNHLALSGDYAVVGKTRQPTRGYLQGDDEVYVLHRSQGTWRLLQAIRPEDPAQERFYGSAVALRDSLMFVGNPYEAPVARGFVDVFALRDGRWERVATLRPPATGQQYFGEHLVYTGTRLFVSSRFSGVSGRVYIYERAEDGTWTLTATLSSPVADPGNFGDGLAASDSLVLVHESRYYHLHAFERTPTGWEWRQIVTPPTSSGWHPETGIVISGNRFVTGDRYGPSGDVYVYAWDGNEWSLDATLTDPEPGPFSGRFGAYVALEGSTLMVGAPYDYGRVVEFEFDGSEWVHVGTLAPPVEGPCNLEGTVHCEYQSFGEAIGLDGTRVVVGAPRTAYEGARDAGSVHAFERGGTGWTPRADIVLGPNRHLHRFGNAVSISGGRVAVGASAQESWSSTYVYVTSGAIPTLEARLLRPFGSVADVVLDGASLLANESISSRVFRRTASGWTHEYSLPSANAGDFDGNRMLLGTDRSTGPGWASLHEFTGTGWPRVAYLDALDPDSSFSFGADVALDGDRAYVGAPGIEAGPGARDGAVHVFEFDGLAWRYTLSLSSPDPALALTFGTAIAASGGRLLVGAPAASGRGAAWLYDGTAWMPVARFDGASDADGFGTSVALDGSRAIVGAPLASHPDAGTFAGQALAFAFTGQAWVPLGTLSSAAPRQNERFGTAVDVEGRRFAVGAPYPTPDADEFGAVYLFTDASTVAADDAPVAEARVVSPPVPNPAGSGGAVVRLTLPQPDVVSAYVVDVLGRAVQTLADRDAVAAEAGLRIETRSLAPGRYVVRVTGASFAESVALTVVR